MSLDEVETAMQRYINELEQTDEVFKQVSQQLHKQLEEQRALPKSWLEQAGTAIDESEQLVGAISSQLLVDIRDASHYRLSMLRRYLYES